MCDCICLSDGIRQQYILQHTAKHCNTLQQTSTHCPTLQHTAAHCNTPQHTAKHCNSLIIPVGYTHTHRQPTQPQAIMQLMYSHLQQCTILQQTAPHSNTLQHTAPHCNTLHHTATYCKTLQHNTLQRTPTHSNALQHTATHCNTLQHTPTHFNTLQHILTHLQPAQPQAKMQLKGPNLQRRDARAVCPSQPHSTLSPNKPLCLIFQVNSSQTFVSRLESHFLQK